MLLTYPFLLVVLGAPLGLFVAGLSLVIGRVPGWEDQRRFAAVAASVSAVTACNATTTLLGAPSWLVIGLARFQYLFLCASVIAWLWYLSDLHKVRLGRLERGVILVNALCGLAGLLPGVVFQGRIANHLFLGVTYQDVPPSRFGWVCFAVTVVGGLFVVRRLYLGLRDGHPYAHTHLWPMVALVLAAVHDILVTSGALSSPYLFDFAFLVPVLIAAVVATHRFTVSAVELERLRCSLQDQVKARTSELASVQEGLLRAEKLAALGQLTAGVAQEVSGPANTVTMNLDVVLSECRPGSRLDAEQVDALKDAKSGIERIIAVVKELRDAGQAAESTGPLDVVELVSVVREAIRLGGPAFTGRVTSSVPEGLKVLGRAGPLAKVFLNLITNGLQAGEAKGGAGGAVSVRGGRQGGTVFVRVRDDGVGLSEEVRRRVFEPYFTTKSSELGMGMGLAVARGLLLSLGGGLRLEENAGAPGTTAIVEMMAADAERPAGARAAST